MKRGKDLRVGDSERDRAISLLGEHLTAGRLDVAEFDQRCALIAAARFQAEIHPVFSDLPEPRPAQRQPRAITGRGWFVAAFGLLLAAGLVIVTRQPVFALLVVAVAALWFVQRRAPRERTDTFGRANRSGD